MAAGLAPRHLHGIAQLRIEKQTVSNGVLLFMAYETFAPEEPLDDMASDESCGPGDEHLTVCSVPAQHAEGSSSSPPPRIRRAPSAGAVDEPRTSTGSECGQGEGNAYFGRRAHDASADQPLNTFSLLEY